GKQKAPAGDLLAIATPAQTSFTAIETAIVGQTFVRQTPEPELDFMEWDNRQDPFDCATHGWYITNCHTLSADTLNQYDLDKNLSNLLRTKATAFTGADGQSIDYDLFTDLHCHHETRTIRGFLKRTQDDWSSKLKGNGFNELADQMGKMAGDKTIIPFSEIRDKDSEANVALTCYNRNRSPDGGNNDQSNSLKLNSCNRTLTGKNGSSLDNNSGDNVTNTGENYCYGCGSQNDFVCACAVSHKECGDDVGWAYGNPRCAANDNSTCTLESLRAQVRTYKACFKENPYCNNKRIRSQVCFDHKVVIDSNTTLIDPPIPSDNSKDNPFATQSQKTTYSSAAENAFLWVVDKNETSGGRHAKLCGTPKVDRALEKYDPYQTNSGDIKKYFKKMIAEYITEKNFIIPTPYPGTPTPEEQIYGTPFDTYVYEQHYLYPYKSDEYPQKNLGAYYSIYAGELTEIENIIKKLRELLTKQEMAYSEMRNKLNGMGGGISALESGPTQKILRTKGTERSFSDTASKLLNFGTISGPPINDPRSIQEKETDDPSKQGSSAAGGQIQKWIGHFNLMSRKRVDRWMDTVGKTKRGEDVLLSYMRNTQTGPWAENSKVQKLLADKGLASPALLSAPSNAGAVDSTNLDGNQEGIGESNKDNKKSTSSSSQSPKQFSNNASSGPSALSPDYKGLFSKSPSNAERKPGGSVDVSANEKELILDTLKRRQKDYANDENDTLFETISKAYLRTALKRLFERNEKDK
ncbi:MAG: hypothetical protein HQK53_09070, partial [Oligoflexia bacterium]|nr:hypothetical protein [Oligoflexia bacterium]